MENFKIGENLVYFESDGKKLEGLLYIPEDYTEGQKKPAMVVTRPATGVKEQTASLYAKKFAEKGYITLAFDPKGYGGSEGKPQVENPFSVISDNRNAITYLQSLAQVNPNKIISTGICMGAGHATGASVEDERAKATITISPYLTAHIDYPKVFGGKFVAKTMMFFTQPLTTFLGWFGLNLYIPPVPLKSWMKVIPATPTQTGMLQYYGPNKPGDVPNWKNRVNLHQANHLMTGSYNPFNFTSKFKGKPFFMAYADGGYSTDLMQKFYDDIKVEHKQVMVCEKATHFDLYYKPQYVNPIVENASNFLKENNL